MSYPIRNGHEAAINQMYIQENNATSGVLFDSTNVKTIGDIRAIVSKALNNIGEFSIQLAEAVMPNEMEISTFNDETLKKITYCVNNTQPIDPITSYISWNLYKTPEGSVEVKFRTEGKLGANNLPQMPPASDQVGLVSVTKTNSIKPNSSFENYTTTEESLSENPLLKKEKNSHPDSTKIGFNKNEVAINQMYIEEKSAASGVLFDSANVKRVGEIRAIVTKALNIGEISITILGMYVDDKMPLSDTKNNKMTFEVNRPMGSDPINTYFSWNAHRIIEGKAEMSFSTEWKVSANNLSKIANVSNPRISLANSTTTEPPAIIMPSNSLNSRPLPTPIDAIPSELNQLKLEPKHRLETYITSQARLHKIDGIVKPYITKIGVASFMKYSNGEELIMPRGTWSIYTPKDGTYNFIGLIKRNDNSYPKDNFTYGDAAIVLGSLFRVRVGKISKITSYVYGDLPNAPELKGKYQMLNFPMPGKFATLFDRILVHYNESEKVWLKS